MKKQISLFDHLDNLTIKKILWKDLSEMDRKSFSVYIINRFFSMNIDLIEIVNYLQKYTLEIFSPETTYKLYLDFLPKKKFYLKYIKAQEKNYNNEMLEYLSNYFQLGKGEVSEYADILLQSDKGKKELKIIVTKYGIEEKSVDKWLGE